MIVFKVIVFLSAHVVICEEVLNLNGKWLLKDSQLKYNNLPATVPGGIYSDLMNNKIIDDIFYGKNDVDTRWVSKRNWTYYTNFSVKTETLYFQNINLVFEGLDTSSTVLINGKQVGKSKNMFVRYIFDVKNQLKVGVNTIEVRFDSPVEIAVKLGNEQKQLYDIPVDCPQKEYNGECHVNMLRKMQASFAWDWGPAFPSVGIWKDVYIEAYNQSAIRYVSTSIVENKNNDTWSVIVDVYFANNRQNIVNGKLRLSLDTKFTRLINIRELSVKPNNYSEILHTEIINVPKGYVNTWWPNGYGAHDLYNLTASFRANSETSLKTVRVGFRTIKLIQDKLSSGLSFYFQVNDVPIFMKGSNEIPIDILPERGQNKTTIKKLLNAASDSHMNMLRVWGGGVYESDYFYDIADELGILIWQDFMFACSMYPVNDDYLKNVLDEVRHQVKRLKGHPCIALFAGNNENEIALVDNWYNTLQNRVQFEKDYIKLYVDTIRPEFKRLTNGNGIYVISSPSNGKQSEAEGYISNFPGSVFYGDVHFYNYIVDPLLTDTYPIPRFVSEYGYQSLPSANSLLKATDKNSDLNINSSFLQHRQHKPLGYITMGLLLDYQLPQLNESNVNHYKAFIYHTQILQAMAIKIETEQYRRCRSSLDKQGQGYTMGALYWQLNDVWLAPTWSGIDFTGKWKMLQYYTQNFFALLIITGHINVVQLLEVFVVSDLLSPVFNATARIQVYNWNSLNVVASQNLSIDLKPGCSHSIKSIDVNNYLVEKGCGSMKVAKNNCFFYLMLESAGESIAPDNFILPTKIKNCNALKPNIKINNITKKGDQEIYSIEIVTDRIALFVWLDTDEIPGRFSDNGFLLVTRTRNVFFYSDVPTNVSELKSKVTITNLYDQQ